MLTCSVSSIGSQDITTTSEAERRAMIMVNPGKGECPFTTDTILAAWQLLLPGEKALCHRHTIFALRFLIEGSGVSGAY
jgi:gentisate 1,2-dioxygenase